jgi:hypothetical protein
VEVSPYSVGREKLLSEGRESQKRRNLMARTPNAVLNQPVFSEGGISPDPAGFSVAHPSDNDLYKEIGDRLKKDVVGFDKARGNPDDVYSLQTALGLHGPEIVQGIK